MYVTPFYDTRVFFVVVSALTAKYLFLNMKSPFSSPQEVAALLSSHSSFNWVISNEMTASARK